MVPSSARSQGRDVPRSIQHGRYIRSPVRISANFSQCGPMRRVTPASLSIDCDQDRIARVSPDLAFPANGVLPAMSARVSGVDLSLFGPRHAQPECPLHSSYAAPSPAVSSLYPSCWVVRCDAMRCARVTHSLSARTAGTSERPRSSMPARPPWHLTSRASGGARVLSLVKLPPASAYSTGFYMCTSVSVSVPVEIDAQLYILWARFARGTSASLLS